MKFYQILPKTKNILGSRLALNIYFCLFLFILKSGDSNHPIYSKAFCYAIIAFYISILATMCYVHNFVLLPRLLFKKKTGNYIISTIGLLLVTSFVYVFFLKFLPAIFPGLDSQDMSVFMFPISDEISLNMILEEMLSYLIIFIPLLVLFGLTGMYHNNLKKVKEMEQIINKHREVELAFLKSQINPHFLFNTFNNLYGLSLKKSDQTAEFILKLSTILRYILYESNTPLVAFHTEKEIMQSYIDIELLRIENSPHLNFSMTADANYQVPPLIWLPILENMFKHTRMVEQLEADFRFAIRQNKLSLFSKNNFSENENMEDKKVGGIGLQNLKKRLELLYPDKHNISIKTENGYFIVEVQIDLK